MAEPCEVPVAPNTKQTAQRDERMKQNKTRGWSGRAAEDLPKMTEV